MMTYVAFALSLFVAAMGALGIVSPPKLLALVRRVLTPGGLYGVAALRLLLGVSLTLRAWAAIPLALGLYMAWAVLP